MATTQPQIQGEITRSSNRMVWVLNLDPSRSYKAEFQGVKIVIPAFGEKIPKHVRDGGNLMEYLAARKFITDYKQPQEYSDRGEPQFFPKMLIDKELSDDEYAKIFNKTSSDLKKEVVAENKKASRILSKSLKEAPVRNKVSLADQETSEG